LVSLLKGEKAEYAIEQAVVVLSIILRKSFPGRFESIIQTICANVGALKDECARGALCLDDW
jgi:hypothetical protein